MFNTNKKVRFTQDSIDRKEKLKLNEFTKPQNNRDKLEKDILLMLSKAEESIKKLSKKL